MKVIAGVDEVGRGSLIGPVYAAAVILDKSITYNSLILDTTRMNWLTSNDKLYISPILNNVRTSIDTLPGYVTFHNNDYLQIRSFLTLVMDSKIVTGTSDED